MSARILLTVLFTLGCCGLSSLGLWQLDRARQKTERHERFLTQHEAPTVDFGALDLREDSDVYRWRKVAVRGHYRDFNVVLDNRTRGGRAGYEVLTPFETTTGTVLLVDRGWVPLEGPRDSVPALPTPGDPTALSGYLGGAPVGGLRMFAAGETDEWLGPRTLRVQHATIGDLARATNTELYPLMLYLDAGGLGAFDTQHKLPGDGSDRHRAYAVQWFAMALILAGIGVHQWRRGVANRE